MKNLLITLLVLLSVGCSTVPVKYQTLKGKKNCLVNAIGFQDAYNADAQFDKYRWSRVLCIVWRGGAAHAVCVFAYQKKDKVIMVYDNRFGGWVLSKALMKEMKVDGMPSFINLQNSPMELAKLWAPNTDIIHAYFMEDLE